ncbi:SapC family protein [Brucella pituitosa]|uniref:SapC family protein n=1 Tax=Brucella pituitosa TaxID=571256 RepID=A0A643EWE7_9HYPH|nr:SapC family protein [Brucella pituitosa]KAB0566162.1 SapC family protein [Brucella pituitosa]
MTDMVQPSEAPVTPAGLPLFYKKPTLLRFEEHKDLALKRSDNVRFAAKSNAIPLVAGEFAAALRSFPIVFTGDDVPVPIAVLGLENEKNLFVDGFGSWRKGTYVPAYVRRYPFISLKVEDDQQLLCADLSSDRIVKAGRDGAELLFNEKGEATESTAAIIALCQAMNDDYSQTTEFAKAIKDAGLLVQKHADVTLNDKRRFTLDGFYIVDLEAFRNLPPETLGEWNRKGWLELIVLHIASQSNWQELMELQITSTAKAAG